MTPELWARERIIDLNTSAGSRVYTKKLPQRPTLPAVRVQRIGNRQDQHLRGPQPFFTRVQVDSFVAEDSVSPGTTIETLAEAIKGDGLGYNASGLWGFKGESDGSPAILIENVTLLHDGTADYEGDELKLLRIRQDYGIFWRAAA